MTRTQVASLLTEYAISLAAGEVQQPGRPHLFERQDGNFVLHLPYAIHAALCTCTAIREEYPEDLVWICDGCVLAVDHEVP